MSSLGFQFSFERSSHLSAIDHREDIHVIIDLLLCPEQEEERHEQDESHKEQTGQRSQSLVRLGTVLVFPLNSVWFC